MAQMAVLKVMDEVRVDTRRLDEIVFELGAPAAHQVFDSALERLSEELHRVEAASRRGDAAAIVSAADQIGRLAWRLGLVTLSGVAVDLARCAEHGDAFARAAVQARLMRVGSCSLERCWTRPRSADRPFEKGDSDTRICVIYPVHVDYPQGGVLPYLTLTPRGWWAESPPYGVLPPRARRVGFYPPLLEWFPNGL